MVLSCSHNRVEYPVINPDELTISNKQFMDCVDTIIYVQLDNTILVPKIIKPFWLDSCIIIHSYEGVLKYDMSGRFLNKIGDIGEGPEEYPKISYYVAVDKRSQVVYVYLIFKEELLSYSFSGEFLKRIPVQIPDDLKKKVYPDPNAFFVQDGLLFFYYNTNQGADGDRPLYWLSVKKDGTLAGYHKGNKIKPKNTNGAGYFLFPMNAYNNTVAYWDLLNDTVFSVGAHGVTPLYLWGKGDFRLLETDEKPLPIERRICTMFADTKAFSLFLMTNYSSDYSSKIMFYGYYDKGKKKFYKLNKSNLIFDERVNMSLWGREMHYDEIGGREYLMTQIKANELLKLPESLPWGLDLDDIEGGNPVLVLIRLKEDKGF